MKHFIETDPSQLACRTTRNFALVVSISSLANAIRWYFSEVRLESHYFLAFLVSTICFLGLHLHGKKMKSRASMAFWICFAVLAYTMGLTNLVLAQTAIDFGTFAGFKLAAIVIALLAPRPLINGYLAVAACGLIPVGIYLSFQSLFQSSTAIQEPSLTVVTAGVCLIVLYYRNRSFEIERSYARLVAQREKLREVAQIFLAMRDLCNTPLQSIRLTASLLESEHVSSKQAAKHLNESLDKLIQLSKMLAQYQIDQDPELNSDSLYNSFDPILFLQKKLSSMQTESRDLGREVPVR